jgi:poly-gamma-glutamate synthesis protein (capsule biosynthesis protein)
VRLSRRDVLRAGVALPAAALSVAAGCASTNGRVTGRSVPKVSTSESSLPPASSTTEAPATVPPRSAPGAVTFAFAGDTHFVDRWDTEGGAVYTGVPVLADQLRADPLHLLDPVTPIFSRADVAMVNLETAITERGRPVGGKAVHFRSSPESFAALRVAGVDVVNMANNHALDYGPEGMVDTFAAIEAYGFPVVGIGHDADEAYRPYRKTINGQRIAIFGALDWLEPALVAGWTAKDNQPGLAFTIDPTRLLAGVSAVRPEVDTLVAFLHWGTEYTDCASPVQSSLAQALLAAGADIVVGSHAHRVFGAGHVGPSRSLVAYGLGNFVWWREDGESGSSGVLLVRATGRRIDSYGWVPARITRGIPVPETDGAAAAALAQWAELRTCSDLSA